MAALPETSTPRHKVTPPGRNRCQVTWLGLVDDDDDDDDDDISAALLLLLLPSLSQGRGRGAKCQMKKIWREYPEGHVPRAYKRASDATASACQGDCRCRGMHCLSAACVPISLKKQGISPHSRARTPRKFPICRADGRTDG